jgi:hypothetical protein
MKGRRQGGRGLPACCLPRAPLPLPHPRPNPFPLCAGRGWPRSVHQHVRQAMEYDHEAAALPNFRRAGRGGGADNTVAVLAVMCLQLLLTRSPALSELSEVTGWW